METVSLEGWTQILLERVMEEILIDPHPLVAVPLHPDVLVPSAFGRDLDHKARCLPFLPKQIGLPHPLRNPLDDEDIRSESRCPVSPSEIEQQVAGDIHVWHLPISALEGRDQVEHFRKMDIVLRHRSPA